MVYFSNPMLKTLESINQSQVGPMGSNYIKIPSQVIRMEQLKPSDEMRPNLRYARINVIEVFKE